MNIRNGAELLAYCTEHNMLLSDYALENELEESNLTKQEIFEKMRTNLHVMIHAVETGTQNEIYSVTGLIGGDGYKLNEYAKSGKSLTGTWMVKLMARAIASSEVNASMGKIVACPTAGSCGIIPAVITTVGEELHLTEDQMIRGLFATAAIGEIIAQNATMAGAEGGCQAECGSAAAMAAAAVVELMGGTVEQSLNAAAIVIKNILGLVCDPIAGLVEIPCAKRNVSGAVSAMTTADLVMAGVMSKIPFDDTVEAMYRVGKALPSELRETAQGGLATTKTGQLLNKRIYGE